MYIISLSIRDRVSKEPLEGAAIMLVDSAGKSLNTDGTVVGRTADENGKINIPVNDPKTWIKVQYMGYKTLHRPAEEFKTATAIDMDIAANELDEVVIRPKDGPRPKPKPIKAKQPAKPEGWPTWLIISAAAAGALLFVTIIYKLSNR